MVKKIKLFAVLMLFFLFSFNATPVKALAKKENYKTINIEKTNDNINISIDTKEIGKDLEFIEEKAVDGFNKLEETGFFTMVFDLSKSLINTFSEFIHSIFSTIK